jgi:hypothetical protein
MPELAGNEVLTNILVPDWENLIHLGKIQGEIGCFSDLEFKRFGCIIY